MLRRLRLATAGESHGRGLLATLSGLPAGLPFPAARIDAALALRQGGFGRSSRQRLEHDRVEVLAGVVGGKTSGAPLCLVVWNRDESLARRPALSRPRPGHADLAGGCKYGTTDMRGVLERASARETAARVAAGACAEELLARCGIEVLGYVRAVGRVPTVESFAPGRRLDLARAAARRDRSAFHVLDARAEAAMKRAVLAARRAGDTLGGCFEVRAHGVPPGLGSLEALDSRLDGRVGAALLSIPAIKAVEIGEGVAGAGRRGSEVHDEIGPPNRAGPVRASNRAGGIEGGMSNGEPIVARAWMKPLPTLARPLASWDYATGRREPAFFERADVTAVPAAAIVGQAMLALVLLDALLEKTGGDSLPEVQRALSAHRRAVARRFGRRSGR